MTNNDPRGPSVLRDIEGPVLEDQFVIVNGYRAEVVDGMAAGSAFWQIKFLEGPWKDLAVWFEDDEGGYLEYIENVSSDGFGFNWNQHDDDHVDIVEGNLLPLPDRTFLSITKSP